jgi:hypothetical protein
MTAVQIVIGILIFVLGVLWIALPFALFGLKPILRDILAELKRQRRLPS